MGQSTAFGNTIAMIGVVLFGMGTLFSFITLPVEYDASNRAIAWLQRKNMVSQQELVSQMLEMGCAHLCCCGRITGHLAVFLVKSSGE